MTLRYKLLSVLQITIRRGNFAGDHLHIFGQTIFQHFHHPLTVCDDGRLHESQSTMWPSIIFANLQRWNETRLWQRDRATLYASGNFVTWCASVRKITLRKVCNGEWPQTSFKVIGNGVTRQDMIALHPIQVVCPFLAQFPGFRDITTYVCMMTFLFDRTPTCCRRTVGQTIYHASI